MYAVQDYENKFGPFTIIVHSIGNVQMSENGAETDRQRLALFTIYKQNVFDLLLVKSHLSHLSFQGK